MVVAAASSNVKPADGNVVLTENILNAMRENAPTISSSVIEKDSKSSIGGGEEDVYGEDSATEDQYVTPWTVTVAR